MSLRHLYLDLHSLGVYPDIIRNIPKKSKFKYTDQFNGTHLYSISDDYYGYRKEKHSDVVPYKVSLLDYSSYLYKDDPNKIRVVFSNVTTLNVYYQNKIFYVDIYTSIGRITVYDGDDEWREFEFDEELFGDTFKKIANRIINMRKINDIDHLYEEIGWGPFGE